MNSSLTQPFKVDFMAIGAHADDVELGCGGTIAKMISEGKIGIIVDLCDATMASRGTPEIRRDEAKNAAEILGGIHRVNLGMADAHLERNWTCLEPLIRVIREYQPEFLFTHSEDETHPDHMICAQLVKDAWYKCGLKKLLPEVPSWHPVRIYHYMGAVNFDPTFCVDITQYWEVKKRALGAYWTQFDNPEAHTVEGKSQVSSPEFMESLRVRNEFYGRRIRRTYAEAFWCREIAEVINPLELGTNPY